jgi:hypothetical protein
VRYRSEVFLLLCGWATLLFAWFHARVPGEVLLPQRLFISLAQSIGGGTAVMILVGSYETNNAAIIIIMLPIKP